MEKKNKKDSLNFKNLATKDDIRELDKKMDEQGVRLDKKIDERFGKLDKKIDLVGASLQGQITRIENKINTEMATKDDINRVITYMDKFVEIADTYKKQDLMRGEAIITHSDQLQNHENRIKLLESAKK